MARTTTSLLLTGVLVWAGTLACTSGSDGKGESGSGGSGAGGTSSSGGTGGVATAGGGTGGVFTSGGATGDRPDIMDVVPPYFGFGYSSFSAVRSWPPTVKASDGINWNFMYWYHLESADDTVLPARLAEASENDVIPVLTHYQLLDRGRAAGYDGAEEWDVVIQAIEDPDVMRAYYDNVQELMEVSAGYDGYVIFQTEPDSTTWLRQYHTDETQNATNGYAAVAASGHPDLADLPDTIAGYAQGLVRLRDLYAPDKVFMGLCIFDNENGYNPDDSVTFIESLGTNFDLLFTHHVVKYTTKDDGWWDAYSEADQARFVTWIDTISKATGLRYVHWQTVIGASDFGPMPDYPNVERITPLVEAGSIANLFDLYTLDGPPHSQPWHGFSTSPPTDHPAYNSLDKLVERLGAYYAEPITLPR